MGGLMLFTALTTTACYGTPALMNLPAPPTTSTEKPLRKVPASLGKAYVFVRKADGSQAERTFPATARLTEEGVLMLSGGNAASAELFKLTARVSPEHLPKGEVPGAPIDLSREVFQAETRMSGPTSDASLVIGQGVAGALTAPTGTLELKARGDGWLAGVLRLQAQGDMLEVYFRLAT